LRDFETMGPRGGTEFRVQCTELEDVKEHGAESKEPAYVTSFVKITEVERTSDFVRLSRLLKFRISNLKEDCCF